MTDVATTLDDLSPGERVSLIVKPTTRPDERDDVDATVVKVQHPYLLDDGESLYTISHRNDAFRVTADGLDMGELRRIVR